MEKKLQEMPSRNEHHVEQFRRRMEGVLDHHQLVEGKPVEPAPTLLGNASKNC